MFVLNCKVLGQIVSEKSLVKFPSDRKRKRINKGTDKYNLHDTQYNFSYLMFVPSFKILSQVVLEKSLTENFVRERKNEQLMGLIIYSNMWLFFVTQYNSLLAS